MGKLPDAVCTKLVDNVSVVRLLLLQYLYCSYSLHCKQELMLLAISECLCILMSG